MKKRAESILGMACFGPALVLLTLFLFLPMILTLVFSFTDFFALNPSLTHFVGLDNYFQVLKDEDFRQAFSNTVRFVIIIVPLQGLGALGLALLINRVTHCKTYLQSGRNSQFYPCEVWYGSTAVYQQCFPSAPIYCRNERMAGSGIPDDYFSGRPAGDQSCSL